MAKYLYGVSVQGIQGFIFETNKLKEIIGASELIKSIDEFENEFDSIKKISKESNFSKNFNVIRNAGGNIRLEVDEKYKKELEELVRELPKKIMQKAYGITISQAVVKCKNDDYKKNSFLLQEKLKTERNKVSMPLDFSFSILKQNPRTSKPAVEEIRFNDSTEYRDKATDLKLAKVKEKYKDDDETLEMNYLSNKKNKIAIIHADGNGLGDIVKKLSKKGLKKFSKDLTKATENAFNTAHKKIIDKLKILEEEKIKILKKLEAKDIKNNALGDDIKRLVTHRKVIQDISRNVVLGGDDLTIIYDANYALEFTKSFLEEFEKETKRFLEDFEKETMFVEKLEMGYEKLTACAGIAYCGEKFPFHYAVNLAEHLCKDAKKESDRKASALKFHNIQSSYFKNFEEYKKHELTIEDDIDLDFGAYFLNDEGKKRVKIEDFIELKNEFKKDNSPIGKLREWLGELHKDKKFAEKKLDRINEVISKEDKKEINEKLKALDDSLGLDKLLIKKEDKDTTPIYDVLQILSVEDKK